MVTAKVYRSRNSGLPLIVIQQEGRDSYVIECQDFVEARKTAGSINNVATRVRLLGESETLMAENDEPKLWQRLNVLSHRFGYDSKEARDLSEAAEKLRALEK